MTECLSLFEATISVIRPRLIIALGTGASTFLSYARPNEVEAWRGNSIASMDEKPIISIEQNGIQTVFAAITHPSHSNSWQRKPPYRGTEGEIRLLSEAATLAGLRYS
jgi:uracil-DNA glycosylase